MESDLQQQHLQINSGLTRYRSAPSSYFSSFIDTQISQEFLHPRPSSPETERILARFIAGTSGGNTRDASASNNFRKNYLLNEVIDRQSSMKSEEILQNYHQSSPHPPLPSQNSPSSVDYRNRSPPVKIGGVSNSNLSRQNSSPAGLFSNFNVDRAGHMATIPEIGNKNMGGSSPDNEGPSNNYITGFSVGSWDDSVIMSENIAGMKRFREDDASEIQNLEAGNRPPQRLAHHLSLPKTSAEMSAIEKYLQLQDSVPCKIRAKRGCATHPRSIAERMRRTRISERMRKLQELVPNMDKQTNTSDMLDLAVEHIKNLQRQVKTLSDNRAKCTCSSRQQL